jgi:hypothetical protein
MDARRQLFVEGEAAPEEEPVVEDVDRLEGPAAEVSQSDGQILSRDANIGPLGLL